MSESNAEKSSPDHRAPDDAVTALDEALARVRREVAGAPVGDGGRARLDTVLAAIQPMLARIPADAEMFDVGVTPGFGRDGAPGRPRLFLDMVAALECEGEGYRLMRATRQGPVALGEASDVGGAVRLVADYVARRLVERERALDGAQAHDLAPRPAAARDPLLAAPPPGQIAPARPLRARDADRNDRDAAERAFPQPEGRENAYPDDRDDSRRLRRATSSFERARPVRDDDDWPAPEPARLRTHAARAPRDDIRDAERDVPATVRDAAVAAREAETTRDAPPPPPARTGLRARLAAARRRLTRWGAPGERRGGVFERGLTFAVQFLGSAALTLVVAMVAWWAWKAAGFVK
jgi:hypothetical protein